ncbi:MAG: hypothetical protein LBD24_05050, partial [Spirochaetaceae bacterium]|nr:hypothetical protein [Spirochaetaceae bacterium]
TGSIFKTGSGYTMSLHIANTRDGRINASSSGAYTLEALENLTGIRKAAAELLPQLASLGPVSDGFKQRPAERGKAGGDRLAASGGWGGRPPQTPR